MSEIIRDEEEVVRIIMEEGEEAVQCRVPGGEWRCARDGFFTIRQWRRTPKPVPPGDLTYEQAVEHIKRHEPVQYYCGTFWRDSTANKDWNSDSLDRTSAYRRKLIKRVPLGPEDVKIGDWIRGDTNPCLTAGVLTVDDHNRAVFMASGAGVVSYKLDSVMSWSISRDSGKTWQPCWKEATE